MEHNPIVPEIFFLRQGFGSAKCYPESVRCLSVNMYVAYEKSYKAKSIIIAPQEQFAA